MLCKVACRTTNRYWFFWDDQLFSSIEKAHEYIGKQKEHVKDDLFLVYPDRMKGWTDEVSE